MRPLLFAAATAALTFTAFAVFGAGSPKTDLNLIDDFNRLIQQRFADPAPEALGMSRITRPNSFGTHYIPTFSAAVDFSPMSDPERTLVAELAERKIQAGLYVVGGAISSCPADYLNWRALKGPAKITPGTPRPAWYPELWGGGDLMHRPKAEGSLPDWYDIYSLAQHAMSSFRDGGKGFETSLDSWTIAARPVLATQERCVTCHNTMSKPSESPFALPNAPPGPPDLSLNSPAGGVLYAFRRMPE